MECNWLSAIFFCCILVATEAYQMTNFSSPTKLIKMKNVDLTIKCLLLDKHEKFNLNASVTWWLKKTCRISCWNQPDVDEWTEIMCADGSCKTSLDLTDETASNGFYLCKIFPYQISETTILHIEVAKTFHLEIVDPMLPPPPEILADSPNQFSVSPKSQLILQCKCRSTHKPTIKWFKQKDDSYINSDEHTFESYRQFIESSRSIKYFENFYEPLASPGLKELNENLFLSKLIINNITKTSTYVCVAINYYGFSYREIFIVIDPEDSEELEESVIDFPEKNYELLFLIPVVLLMPISALCCTILYLLINRQILRRNKTSETI